MMQHLPLGMMMMLMMPKIIWLQCLVMECTHPNQTRGFAFLEGYSKINGFLTFMDRQHLAKRNEEKPEKPLCSNYALLNLFFLAETENPIFGTGSIH